MDKNLIIKYDIEGEFHENYFYEIATNPQIEQELQLNFQEKIKKEIIKAKIAFSVLKLNYKCMKFFLAKSSSSDSLYSGSSTQQSTGQTAAH